VFNAGDGVEAILAREQRASAQAGDGESARRQAGVMFGGESSGLDNNSVALCDAILTYPVAAGFTSLNLSMAVGMFCHAWGAGIEAGRETKRADAFGGVDVPASRDDLLRMYEHFEAELERAGYFYPPEKTPVMTQNLRAAFARGDWTTQEVRTFRGAIKALAIGRGKARIERPDEA